MANPYKQFVLLFRSAHPIVAGFPGQDVLNGLGGYIDTDSADVKVGAQDVQVRFVTILTEKQILKICDEVKKSLEKTSDERLIYKIEVISL